jgi:hypothetical protein
MLDQCLRQHPQSAMSIRQIRKAQGKRGTVYQRATFYQLTIDNLGLSLQVKGSLALVQFTQDSSQRK